MERKDVLPEFRSILLVLGNELLINPMDDVHLALRHLLVLKNFCSSASILASRLPSPFETWTSLICNSPSLSNNSFGCIFSSLIYGLMISARGFSSDGPDEGIATPKLRKIP
jgi:hypothetical protein